MVTIMAEPILPDIWKDRALPCPFCGEKKRLFINKIGFLYNIECHSCGARGSKVTSDNPALPVEALDAWNKAPRQLTWMNKEDVKEDGFYWWRDSNNHILGIICVNLSLDNAVASPGVDMFKFSKATGEFAGPISAPVEKEND